MADHIRYDLLTQQALRGVVRRVLADAAKKGLPGEHHFYISFMTGAEGVRLSERLRLQYPEQMTVILQHQFWDLAVTDHGFEVGMSFGGIPEKLYVPFDAVAGFFDPSVQFGLQFEEVAEGEARKPGKDADKLAPPPAAAATEKAAKKPRLPAAPPPVAPTLDAPGKAKTGETEPPPLPDKPDDDGKGGGQVVRLDRFRKK